ncbi:MAG: FkbM family methyltransferase [Deltaproteobacteria bacterium]|nr:FkbM family methyltransferase [Deltaproteobacteria bacterium]
MKFFKFKKNFKKTYAQSGEDIILDVLLRSIGIRKPHYLDIGAHDPMKFSNTHFFYKKGCRGVNIEPDPMLYSKFLSKRKRDVNLNIGLAEKNSTLDFYVLSARTLSTFDEVVAKKYIEFKEHDLVETIKVDVKNVNEVVALNFETYPNFVSLDVEGLEMEILKSFDFNKIRPEVFCIETVSYDEGIKDIKIINFMESVGYMVYADTFINTIFVDKKSWECRRRVEKK